MINTTPQFLQNTDLTKQPPRDPHIRLNDFVILARMLDKYRAYAFGNTGEYHYNCAVDKMLFTFKGISAPDVLAQVCLRKSDQEIADWLLSAGTQRSAQDIKTWSNFTEKICSYNNESSRDWFIGACAALNLDPKTTMLFDYLVADDKATFKK